MDGLSSTFSLTTRALPAYFSATASTVGANMRQGAHQAAQKSTSTGRSDFSTSFSKLLSLTSLTWSLIEKLPQNSILNSNLLLIVARNLLVKSDVFPGGVGP